MDADIEVYLAWNDAVASTVFTADQAGRPVYLDLDDDILHEIGRQLDVPPQDVETGLTDAVRRVLDLTSTSNNIFRLVDGLLSRWRRELLPDSSPSPSAPPVLALLATFVLAAEHMGRERADSPFAQHAYYQRLFDLLHVPSGMKDKFKAAIRDSSEGYWETLARWLDGMHGERGLPSAQALGHRYIGLPISQALVRRADRERLPNAFVQAGLIPGEALDTAEMELVLDEWVARGHGVLKPFRRLWGIPAVRERVCEIAVQELETWQGTTVDVPGLEVPKPDASRLRLVGWLGSSLLRRSATFGLGAPRATSTSWRVAGVDGAEPVTATVRGGSMAILGFAALGVDVGEALQARITLADDEERLWRRTPSESVLLSFDESTEVYVESRRAAHGHDHWFLLRYDIAMLARRLEEFQRLTGSTWRTEAAGVPDGWTLLTGLRVGPATADLDPMKWPPALRSLFPQQRLRIELTGGLRLPGSGDRYSNWAPPQVVGIATDDLLVSRATGDEGPRDAEGNRGETLAQATAALTGERAPLPLPEGDYLISSRSDTSAVAPRTVRLRAPGSQDAGPIGSLGHGLLHTLHDLQSAASPAEEAPMVLGVSSRGECVNLPPGGIGRRTWDYFSSSRHDRTLLSLKPASEMTCLWDGLHQVKVDRSDDGKLQIQRYHCCGRVLVTRTRPRPITYVPSGRTSAETVYPPRAFRFRSPDHTLRDALIYLATGTVAAAEKILDQLGTARRAVDLLADLDATGFLETVRDGSGRITHWAVCPPAISESDGGHLVVTGGWTVEAMAELASIVQQEDGRMDRRRVEDGATAVAHGVRIETLLEYEQTMEGVVNAGNAAHRLIDRLPRLMTAAGVSPLVEMPERGEWEMFSVSPRLGWIPVAAADVPGLYRLNDPWKRSYFFRPQRNSFDRALVVSAALGKHLFAAERGVPLISYDENLRALDVPLGARLPGLYERAACAASGAPPQPAPDGNSYRYSSISPEFAAKLAGRLQ